MESSKSERNDDTPPADLEPHYSSQSTLAWLRKMADSYMLERGEDLLEVITRESSGGDDDVVVVAGAGGNDDATYALRLAVACAGTNLPVASHDFLRDPTGEAMYNYGNCAFLRGFGYEWEEFVRMPSKNCVATEEDVDERQRLLDAVKSNAIRDSKSSDDDAGDDGDDLESKYDNLIRIRKDGRRILLRGVNLWNVYDDSCLRDTSDPASVRARIEKGEIAAIGQAVWIRHVDYLD
jgi:hypothetical protein